MYALFQEYDDSQFLIAVSESIENLEKKIMSRYDGWKSKIQNDERGYLMYEIGPFLWCSIEEVEVV